MGRKIHPYGFRVGVTKDWQSRWYAPHTTYAEFTIQDHGLGFVFVDVLIPLYGLHFHMFLMPTPVDGEYIDLRATVRVEKVERPQNIHFLFRLLPHSLLIEWLAAMTFKGIVYDLQQDFPIWENKIYIQPPALARGDGPIGKVRTWAKQFYQSPE